VPPHNLKRIARNVNVVILYASEFISIFGLCHIDGWLGKVVSHLANEDKHPI
jgi:hypothetical protein